MGLVASYKLPDDFYQFIVRLDGFVQVTRRHVLNKVHLSHF